VVSKNIKNIIGLRLYDRRYNHDQTLNEQGFTLIELLVVIIIIGILAAIALPSFLNQANKARLAEAKTYVVSMSRLQQAYYMEKGRFTDDINRLSLGTTTSTASYSYRIIAGDINGSTTPVQLDRIATNVAEPKSNAFKALVGVVGITALATSTVLLDTAICTSPTFSTIPPGSISADGLTAVCPTGFSIQSQ